MTSYICNLAHAQLRQTLVKVNGELNDPFPVEAGVPQGDPISCLLFVIVIESLSRYLRAQMPGVMAVGVLIRHLLFADDLAMLGATRQELQLALDLIHRWCTAWGMEVGTGQGKTDGRRAGDAVYGTGHPAAL